MAEAELDYMEVQICKVRGDQKCGFFFFLLFMVNQDELPDYKWAETVLEIWVGKKKIFSFLKDENGSENGQWMKRKCMFSLT